MSHDAMFILHRGLLEGRAGSRRLYARNASCAVFAASSEPAALDVGCGTGRQTLVLAKTLNVPVIAVRSRTSRFSTSSAGIDGSKGPAHLIETRRTDFGDLDFPPGSVDLIWSEGAAYIMGFAESLRRWRRCPCCLRD